MMQVAGLENMLLVPASAVLVIIIAIILIKKTGGMRRRPSEEGFESEYVNVADRVESVESDEIQKFKAKIDQLSTALNVEREKVRAKEEQIKEHEKSYENELLKVTALKDEVPFLRKKIGELQEELGKSKAEFEAEVEKVKREGASNLAEEKGKYSEEIQKLEKRIDYTVASYSA
jgi:chromosome segregation ATPase